MTEEQSSYAPFGSEQRNARGRPSQDGSFDLEKYGFYIDKIRALFAPSLEYRIRSLLEEFVYSRDSQSAKRYPGLKRFVDAMVTWKGPLNKVTEYDVGTVEELIGIITNCALKDELITCFLDSIVLHRRLNKICRELDALGIDDNILRSLNAWNFANEGENYRENRNLIIPSQGCFVHRSRTNVLPTLPFHSLSANRVKLQQTPSNRSSDTVVDRNANSNAATCCERPAWREKVVEPLTRSGVHCDGSIECVGTIVPDNPEQQLGQQVPLQASSRNLPRRREGDRGRYARSATEAPPNDDICEPRKFLQLHRRASEKTPCSPKLKVIVRRVYLEDCGCSSLSRPAVARLPLPCKPCDLIGRIFEADPSLTESCLIVMKRKFQVGIRNVCSCINGILGKLNAKAAGPATRTCLSCEIRPGYISFVLKTNGGRKRLFVGRVPICQNVHKFTIPRDASSFGAKTRDGVEESTGSERYEGNATDFDDTAALVVEEESRGVDNVCCSRLDQDEAGDTTADTMESTNAEETAHPCWINGSFPERDSELVIRPYNRSSEKMVETVPDVTSDPGDAEETDEETDEVHCRTSDASVIDCKENTVEDGESDNLEVMNHEGTRLSEDANCACLSSEDLTETRPRSKEETGDPRCTEASGSLSRRNTEGNYTYLSSGESGSRSKDTTSASSITTFARDSERDKQLVELNCNRFSDNKVAEVGGSVEVDSLDSAGRDVERGSNCGCSYGSFVGITVVGRVSEENLRLEAFGRPTTRPRDAIRCGSTRSTSKESDSLAISVRTSLLKVSSKGYNVNISYSATTRLASGDEEGVPNVVKTRDGAANSPSALPTEVDGIFHNVDEEEDIYAACGTRGFITPLGRRAAAKRKKRLPSNENESSHPHVSTEADPRAGDCLTGSASNTCRAFTTRQGARKSGRSRKLHLRYVRASSSNGVRNVTSVTTIKYRRKQPRERQDDYSADVRPRKAFATNRFRKSVDTSLRWIKRLIRVKLAGVFLNHRRAQATRVSRGIFRGSDETGGIARRRTTGKYAEQHHRVIPRSSSNCHRRDYVESRVESSDVTASYRRNRGEERREGGSKLRDRRLAGSGEVLSSFHSIDTTSPCSYDLLTPGDSEARELDGGGRRYFRREAAERKRGVVDSDPSSCDRYFADYETTISSALISLAGDDAAEYLEISACKQREEIRGGRRDRSRRISKKMQRPAGRRGDERKEPIAPIGNQGFSGPPWSSACVKTDVTGGGRKRSHGARRSRNRNRELSSLGENREILNRDVGVDRKRRVFALLTDTYNDCARNLDLDLEFTLSRYVELCRNVKRSLMRTLDDIYEVSSASMPGSDS